MNIMIIAAEFAPSAMIGAKRPTLLALELCKLGHNVLVVSLDPGCMQRVDCSIASLDSPRLTLLRERCRSIWQHMQEWRSNKSRVKKAIQLPLKIFSLLTKNFAQPDELKPWVSASLPRAISAVEENEIEIIWATVPSLSAALLAKKIHANTQIPFVVDYRDILDPDDKSKRSARTRSIEAEILQVAAGVSFTTNSQGAYLLEQNPGLSNIPSCLAHNFFEAYSNPQKERRSHDYIIYGGSLYGGERKIDSVLKALTDVNRDRIHECGLRFFGLKSDIDEVNRVARRENAAKYVLTNSLNSQKHFDKACQNSAVQLLIVGRGRKHTYAIPAKLFDYFRSGRPVLVIAPEACEAGELVCKLNCGLFSRDDDSERIAEAIRLLLEGKNWSGTPLTLAAESFLEFDVRSVTLKLVEFFNKVRRAEKKQ